MATHHDQAICIRHWDFSDTSQTVGMFCRTSGIVRGIAKGARRERGAFSGGMDLLTMGELAWIEARSGDLCTLTSWLPTESWPALRTLPRANTGAWYVLECIGRMLEPHDPHPELFDGVIEAFHGFSRGDVEPSMVRFLWALLGETGFGPRLSTPATETCAFDPGMGCVDHTNERTWTVRSSTLAAIQRALEGDPSLPAADALRGATLLAACVRHHLQLEPGTQAAFFGPIPQGTRPVQQRRTDRRHD